jgi:hypothetical protein
MTKYNIATPKGGAVLASLTFLFGLAVPVLAQDNYEIQVYAAPTVEPGITMVELHNNFTSSGSKLVENGVRPTNHMFHETIEITHGWTPWFETGFYVFMAADTRYGYNWVGDHIRPRVTAPESWKLPVGLSLSAEFGYQRAAYSPDTWTMELRPIIDKQVGKLYLAFNPTIDRAFHGASSNDGYHFSPNAKVGYDFSKKIQAGFEYYGALGPITGFSPLREQEHQYVPSIDLDLSPNWEFNAGVGIGVTQATDHLILKMIIGRRFSFGSKKK